MNSSGQNGQFVFVVKGDSAESRPVRVVRTLGQEAIISQGLEAGEQVVTDGQSRLVPGARVQIKSAPVSQSMPAGESPAGGLQE